MEKIPGCFFSQDNIFYHLQIHTVERFIFRTNKNIQNYAVFPDFSRNHDSIYSGTASRKALPDAILVDTHNDFLSKAVEDHVCVRHQSERDNTI
jgi:hypothetical protein